jgi:outer membrane protein TolC
MSRSALAAKAAALLFVCAGAAGAQTVEQVSFDEAVRRAIERNPSVGEAAQAILRAQALLDRAAAIFRPFVEGGAGVTTLDAARGFNGTITQPRTQWAFAATASYSFLDLARWAERNQAADQVTIARISAEETRRQVARTAAEAYLAVLSVRRQLEIATRNRDLAQALADYARIRLEAGQGSRLNFVRASQEVASAEARIELAELNLRGAQEALGIAMFSDGPVDAAGEPTLVPSTPPRADEAWMQQRPDVRLFSAQVDAAARVVRDTWKSWMPSGTASFTPGYLSPPGAFVPARTWSLVFGLQVPIYDGTITPTKHANIAERETARLRLDALKVQARSEVRFAQESVVRNERIVRTVREASDNAAEALRITEIAYKAGATTNIEVVQAQQTARNAEIAAALAEDQLRQARLDLLVALGQFPR